MPTKISNHLNWLLHTNAGLAARIAIGAIIFLVLALIDLKKHGRSATRWREYAFLLLMAIAAMLYGAINDLVTSTISWEYFYYGKELYDVLGPETPPDGAALAVQAMLVGIKATWSAGLIIGVAMLLANNPRRNRRQLRFAELLALLPRIVIVCVIGAIILGLAGDRGWLIALSSDFRGLVTRDEWRPYRFMTVFGIHLGGYVCGLLATADAVYRILRARRRGAYSSGLAS